MRLIDADALGYEVLEEYGADGGSNDVNVIYGMIINAPTVDAVRQGHWVRFHGDHICMGLRPRWDCCSECGMVGTPTRFCSNCGARMDGEA